MKSARFLVPLLISLAYQLPCSADNTVKDFTLPPATSNSVIHLADHAGKVVLINWWRTSCPWSQAEAPKLVELYNKYHPQGLDIIGVADDNIGTVAQVPTYLKRYGVTWLVGLNDQGEFMCEIRPVGSGNAPEHYLVTRSGQIKYLGADRNPGDWNKLVAVTQALSEKTVAGQPIQPRKLEPAPSLALPDLQGRKTTLSADVSGKPVLINFFNADSCDWAGALVSKLCKEYSARGFQVIGVDLYDSDAPIQQCKAKYGAAYPILCGDQATQQAWIWANKGWAAFFVTPAGKIVKKIIDSINDGIEQPFF